MRWSLLYWTVLAVQHAFKQAEPDPKCGERFNELVGASMHLNLFFCTYGEIHCIFVQLSLSHNRGGSCHPQTFIHL